MRKLAEQVCVCDKGVFRFRRRSICRHKLMGRASVRDRGRGIGRMMRPRMVASGALGGRQREIVFILCGKGVLCVRFCPFPGTVGAMATLCPPL